MYGLSGTNEQTGVALCVDLHICFELEVRVALVVIDVTYFVRFASPNDHLVGN